MLPRLRRKLRRPERPQARAGNGRRSSQANRAKLDEHSQDKSLMREARASQSTLAELPVGLKSPVLVDIGHLTSWSRTGAAGRSLARIQVQGATSEEAL